MLDDRDHPGEAPQGLSDSAPEAQPLSPELPLGTSEAVVASEPAFPGTPEPASPEALTQPSADAPRPPGDSLLAFEAPPVVEVAAPPPALPPTAKAPVPAVVPTPPRGVLIVLALGVLALAGFSLMLGVQSLIIKHTQPAFYTGNALGIPGRTRLLIWEGAGLVLPPLLAAVYAIVRRKQMPGTGIMRAALLFCPLLAAGFVPALYSWEFGQRAPLQYLSFLVLSVFSVEFLLRVSLPSWSQVTWPRWLARPTGAVAGFCSKHQGKLAFGAVLFAAAGYTAYTGYYSIQRHRMLQTFAFDLGIYDNLMYGAMSGRPFRSPVLFGPGNYNYLAGHAEYGMLFFLPIYALKPGAETLLWIQSAVLGFAAVPLFLFARTRLPQWLSAAVAVCYLLFAPLHGPNFYDFHWLPLAIFFHFWLYFALATRRNWLAIPMVFVLLAMREDVAMGLCVLGAFLFLTGERVKFGLILSLVSVSWFAINKFVIMRWAGTWWFENMYAELFSDGQPGYGSVLKTILTNPTFTLATLAHEPKLVYIFHLLAPLAFLPVRRMALVGLLLPGFFFTLLTTGYWPTTSIAFQYTTHWIPYLFLGTVLSLWLLGKQEKGGSATKRLAAALALFLVLTSHSYSFGSILQRESFTGGFLPVNFTTTPDQVKRYQALMSLVNQIPRKASVAATECVNPHVSARVEAYTFRYEVPAVDYVLLSRLELNGDVNKLIANVFKKADYGLVGTSGKEFYLFKKGAPQGDFAGALATLGINHTPRKHHK